MRRLNCAICEYGARDTGHHFHVALFQMDERAVDMVGKERAARAPLRPARIEHEVVRHQLTAAVEQIGQRSAALRPFEHIGLVDANPGQLASLGAQLIPQAGQLLLSLQQVAYGRPATLPGTRLGCSSSHSSAAVGLML